MKMTKNNALIISVACTIFAALCGVAGMFAAAVSVGLASIGVFMISTQIKD